MKKLLFIVQAPNGISPSQRFRLELYIKTMQESNIVFKIRPFMDAAARKIIYREGYVLQKIFDVIKGFAKRLANLAEIRKYDFIVVYREAAPVGPAVFEWMYAKLFRKKLIFDFDDAIWVPRISEGNRMAKAFKCFGKIKYICKWAYKVSAGNMFLYDYARQYNKNVVLNPTCVDTVYSHNTIKSQDSDRVVIGWTGSFSTLVYLKQALKALLQLEKKYEFEFIVIADKDPALPLKNFNFLKWNSETEITDLLTINIGIMPLPDSTFERGKCGFKIIQFMALGIPAVASPVGVNVNIVEPGKNGFLCETDEQWYMALEQLLLDAELRKKMGLAGRKKVVENYSVQSNAANFLSLFQ